MTMSNRNHAGQVDDPGLGVAGLVFQLAVVIGVGLPIVAVGAGLAWRLFVLISGVQL